MEWIEERESQFSLGLGRLTSFLGYVMLGTLCIGAQFLQICRQ